ncbi:MAG TPA: hypothetical protein VFA12_15855 [Stellaceae bacterium]|nr:hypothetical protein [Stellaceae bacterium]
MLWAARAGGKATPAAAAESGAAGDGASHGAWGACILIRRRGKVTALNLIDLREYSPVIVCGSELTNPAVGRSTECR